VKYFADRGYDVHLVTFDKTEEIRGVEVRKLRYLSKFAYPIRILKVMKAVSDVDAHVLHAHFVSHYGVYAALTGFKPLVVTAWGSDVLIEPKKSIIKKYLVKYVLKRADLITCDAEHMKEALKHLGAAPEKVTLIYFGVDTRKFSPREKSEDLKAKLAIYDSPAVISLRSLEPLYDVKSLIEAIPLVLEKIPETKFVIAGGGSEERALKNLAASLGVSNSVRFIGFVPNDELPKYLTSMDVYVSTSLSDAGIAASTAEAMACGLPMIITDVADNRKWVQDGVNGFIIPVRDPKLLAERIVYLLKNENVRKEFGTTNRKIVEERNDYYKEMAKMADIYEKLVERRKK
jgi:glycosyltransferase involved in cell wall biosynthesis